MLNYTVVCRILRVYHALYDFVLFGKLYIIQVVYFVREVCLHAAEAHDDVYYIIKAVSNLFSQNNIDYYVQVLNGWEALI